MDTTEDIAVSAILSVIGLILLGFMLHAFWLAKWLEGVRLGIVFLVSALVLTVASALHWTIAVFTAASLFIFWVYVW